MAPRIRSTEDLVPADHPIRKIRAVVEEVLADPDDVFNAMYAAGRRSVPPETLLKAMVLMAMYSIRSERAFCDGSTTTCCSSGSWTSHRRGGVRRDGVHQDRKRLLEPEVR